eukprot:scaffold158537_cov28-Tisochrysis_lutea.AAC.4
MLRYQVTFDIDPGRRAKELVVATASLAHIARLDRHRSAVRYAGAAKPLNKKPHSRMTLPPRKFDVIKPDECENMCDIPHSHEAEAGVPQKSVSMSRPAEQVTPKQ